MIGDAVLLTEATRCLLASGAESLEPRGSFEQGAAEPIPVYALPVQLDKCLRPPSQTTQAEA